MEKSPGVYKPFINRVLNNILLNKSINSEFYYYIHHFNVS